MLKKLGFMRFFSYLQFNSNFIIFCYEKYKGERNDYFRNKKKK